MGINKFTPILKEARRQFQHEVVTAGLNEGEAKEMVLIEKVAHLISEHIDEALNAGRGGIGVLGAFRVMFSTVEALAGQIDEVIDEHEAKCGCDGTGKNDPNGNGGLLH